MIDLLEEGRSVAQVAYDFGISEASIYVWRRQDRIDKGLTPGLDVESLGRIKTAETQLSATA